MTRLKKNLLTGVMESISQQRAALFIFSCLVNMLLLVTAIYMLQVYDRVLSSGSLATLAWLTVIALIAVVAYGLLEQARRLILSRTASYIESELNAPTLRGAMDLNREGKVPPASVRDVADLRNYFRSDAALSFLDAPWSVIFLAFIWLLHPILGLIATLGAITLFAATLLNDVLTRARQREAAGAVHAANETAVRLVDAGETISTLGMAPAIFSRWREQQNRAHAEQQELGEKTTTILSLTRSLRMGLQIAVLGMGAYLVLGAEITAGAMIAASIITGRALAPIDRLTSSWNRFVLARSAKKKLKALFEEVAKTPDRLQLPRPKGILSVENINFIAPGTSKPILHSIDFSLERPGTCCAVIGPSGAGKSTLCRMLVGMWKPSGGQVRLDGADVFTWDPDRLGPYIGYLPQTVELFPGTIAENIARFGDADSEAIIGAARLAGVHEMILKQPDGYETQVGFAGDRLSLGQRQRIGLARAVYGMPSFVVLDEPNSNLDSAGDAALLSTLSALTENGTTTVIVSHRAEVLKGASKVLALRDGTIGSFGDRDEVLKPVTSAKKTSPQTAIPRQKITLGSKTK
ncbi:type I secretion system permease/ATPase [Boseongicola aestuarii]|uniref:Type I secretion system ATP-binding protein PrsD n=1 Tax=Boseongicola aestuarii TaxID=1470561 RepID=A0A238J2Y6_9RHOB|nr:type I secretion system permease/ATPase [Boseongicola aestuarii]SMX24691.1 Type I secretion system ATP-binding protein PrsD [Boseongicola aestuarii]